jgi:hypothetical protein
MDARTQASLGLQPRCRGLIADMESEDDDAQTS